jgi:hypothetical protein
MEVAAAQRSIVSARYGVICNSFSSFAAPTPSATESSTLRYGLAYVVGHVISSIVYPRFLSQKE